MSKRAVQIVGKPSKVKRETKSRANQGLALAMLLNKLTGSYLVVTALLMPRAMAQNLPTESQRALLQAALNPETDQELIESSPTLQRWLEQPPDLLQELQSRSLIPTRMQAGLDPDAWTVGLEDVRLFDRLTVSGDYRRGFEGGEGSSERQFGSALRYYLAPLGSLVNVAPVVGYRQVEGLDQTLRGVELGAHAVLIPAPGAADLTLSYTWISPSADQPTATLAQVTSAYTLTPSIRVGARYRRFSYAGDPDTSFGMIVEWIP